jgi:catechol 2,3-dioxygenase-like lactoylglutathione lyase family enzyme
MERPAHAGLRHLALHARDLEAMKRFYIDVLGFEVEWEPDPDNVYLSSGVDNLALHRTHDSGSTPAGKRAREERHVPATRTDTALDHLGLIVRSAADVDRWAAFLESRNVRLDAAPRTHRDGARSCYFRDPDGNSIQIIHHPPISGRI